MKKHLAKRKSPLIGGGTAIELVPQGYLRSGGRQDRQAGRSDRLAPHPGGHSRWALVVWCVCRQGVTPGSSSEGMLGGQAWGKEAKAPEPGTGLTQGPGSTPRRARLPRWCRHRIGRRPPTWHRVGGVRMTHTSIPGLGRMAIPLLEISAQEEERVVGAVLIAELFMVISKVISLPAVCEPVVPMGCWQHFPPEAHP